MSSSNNNLQGSHVISFNFTEKDFYEEEIKELLLDILKKINNVNQDSRRQHIISDILEHNPSNNKREEIERYIRDVFWDYIEMTDEKRKELENIGFEFIPDGKHYKVRFEGDSRYPFYFSKTPSDQNSGKHIIQDIKNKLF